jgi:hypothetical protein
MFSVRTRFKTIRHAFAAMLLLGTIITGSCWAASSYNAAADFEAGWRAQKNPNGVWSYGYSSGFTDAITLYDSATQPGINAPNAQYWLSPSVDIGSSPAAQFNDGAPYNDGNVDFLAYELVLVSGIGGQYSNLVFTAPTEGVYLVEASFRGAQYGVGTVVGVVANGKVIFNSSVTSVGQIVPFHAEFGLKAGAKVVFSGRPWRRVSKHWPGGNRI